jgi:DNA-binding NtrC family response regulator
MNKLKALIIDDSTADVALLIRELQKNELEVDYLRVDTQKDLDAAITAGEWDIILCDYIMPGFDGLQALEQIRNRGVDIPVIMISGQVGEDVAVDAMRAGASDYVMKSHLKRLVPAIQRELREAEDRRQQKKTQSELAETTRELEVAREMDKLKD